MPPSASHAELAAGAQITLSATVRNAGDGVAEATTLRYYRSADAAITRADVEVGTVAVAALAAAGSGSHSVDLVAPSTPGTYYYGACVDAVTDESDTTNNCSNILKVTVRATVTEPPVRQDRPDLVVTSPSVSDSTPAAGTDFTLSVAVRNAGADTAEATTVRYYQSADATITRSDAEVGTESVAELAASGSRGQSVELAAPSTPGTYYYGACVDAVTDESDTTNNCSTAARVTVPEPTRPDLLVTSPSVSDRRPVTGASFTLSATVRNDGDGTAAATTLRYYRSTDAMITTSDTQAGSDAVAELAAAGSGSHSVDLVAPSTVGTYYYGACVDAVAGESDAANNCSASVEVAVQTVQVTVPEPRGQPDLTVSSPSVSDHRPTTGTSFTLAATVSNAGDARSAAATLRYYRSADSTITTTDTQVGTDSVGALAASGTSAESISLTAPATAGAYYYGACVDAVTDESDTTNNCSASVQVTVQTAETGPRGEGQEPAPDLTVTSPSVNDSDPAAGATFTLSATVSNAGDGEAATTTLRYYRSADATITTSDSPVGTDALAKLAASGTSAESISLTAPATPGAYYYGACVDPVTDESDTTNNCSASVQVTVRTAETGPRGEGQEPAPDLTVTLPSVNDSNPAVGATFTLSATVSNAGDGESPATTLRYYRSADSTITTSDSQVGTDSVGALAASGTSAESISLTAPATAGAYYYGACVDAVTDESDTTNNCSTSAQVTVQTAETGPRGEGQEPAPDLTVTSPSVNESDPAAGATFTLSATVSNAGDGEAAATTLRYYRSADATITASDTPVGTDAIAKLAAAGTSAESISLTAPTTPGAYYYGACVDAVTDESDTTNNCSTSAQVTVQTAETGPRGEGAEPAPDLTVTSPSVSDGDLALGATFTAGATFTLSVTVSNEGDGEAAATTLRYYESTDATITTSDSSVGMDTIAKLAAAGTSAESTSWATPSSSGVYYYGACVDTVTGESDTTNNCSSAVQVNVQAWRKPNLQVDKTTVDLRDPVTGETFTLSATVTNARRAASTATTLRYYRSADRTITTEDTEVGTDAVGALSAYGSSTESISLTAPATVGAYYYGACVDAVMDESYTADNCSAAVKVDVVAPQRRVDISPRTLTLEAVGDSETVTVRVLDENGAEDAHAIIDSISTSPPGGPCCAFTDVDNGLQVTMNKIGRMRVDFISTGAKSATLQVTAYQKATTLEVSPDSVSLQVDETATLSATVKDANGGVARGPGLRQGDAHAPRSRRPATRLSVRSARLPGVAGSACGARPRGHEPVAG